MENHQSENFMTFHLTDAIQENIIPHEQTCQSEEQVLRDFVQVSTNNVTGITESQGEVPGKHSDEEETELLYPVYIKKKPQKRVSGDDESMAVEALRQLGSIYPILESKKVNCPTCNKSFKQSQVAKHQSICSIVPKLSCINCGEAFDKKEDLDNHKVCHLVNRPPFACAICGSLFRSRRIQQSHMQQMHQKERGQYKCTMCSSVFRRPSSLSNHLKIHSYAAGRAMKSKESNASHATQKTSRPENTANSQDTSQVSSEHSTTNYLQIQWPEHYLRAIGEGEQSTVTTTTNHPQKMHMLQEFTVMPNGEMTPYQYTGQNSIDNPVDGQQFNLVNSLEGVQIKVVPYNNENKRNYVQIEATGKQQESKQKEKHQRYICKYCGTAFSRATTLTLHERSKHCKRNWDTPIDCKYCDKQFQNGDRLTKHLAKCRKKIMQNNIEQGVSNNPGHACSVCDKKFSTKQKMFRHQWIHRKKMYVCEICSMQFEQQSQLDEHRLSDHSNQPHSCTECGKSFVSRQGLWEHSRIHVGSPAHFQCEKCSKSFSSRQGYLIHNRVHTGERPYGCQFCWKSFRDGGTLRKHERIHTGERPHVCPLCMRAFNQKVVLREHVRWVHTASKNELESTNPPYRCPCDVLCNVLSQDREELCAHIVKHSDQMIADAKAKKIPNVIRPKSKKKRSKKTKSSSDLLPTSYVGDTLSKQHILDDIIAETQEDEALSCLSITNNPDNELHVVDENSDNPFVVMSTKKPDDGYFTISENSDMHFIVEDTQDDIVLEVQNQNSVNVIVSPNKCNDATQSVVSVTESANDTLDETIHLIQASPAKENTHNIISKQILSMPVLTSPHGHDYLSPIVVDEYDENEETTCGICTEEFNDRDALKEHIKMHI